MVNGLPPVVEVKALPLEGDVDQVSSEADYSI